MAQKESLNPTATNREVGFFPSETALVTEYGTGQLHAFMWVECYFDAATVTQPLLLAWDGHSVDGGGNKIINPYQFAYSGQQKPCRGKDLVATGVDYLGNSFTATDIGDGGLAYVYIGGGARP